MAGKPGVPHDTHRVRPAEARDAAAIAAVYNQSIRAGDATMDTVEVVDQDVHRWLAALSDRETIMVLDEGQRVAGWGIVKRYSDRPGYAVACETSVYLDRSCTGRGLGPLVQRRLMAFCRHAGYHHVVAKIWAANDHSIRMHERFGFQVVGVQREIGFVAGQWRDVALMQCVLDTPTPGAD